MKILNLELQNFRNHKHTYITFDRINFIGGKNNAGKTSIKGALQYVLTGENEWISGGKNAKEQIKYGETRAIIEAEIEDLGIIRRIITNKGNVTEFNSHRIPDKELEKEYKEGFDIEGYDIISCMLDAGKFLCMKPNEQKDFLFRLTNVALNPQKIIDFMDNPSSKAIDVVQSFLSGNTTIDTFDVLYNEFYAARKIAKKELASIQAKIDAIGTIPISSGVDIAKVMADFQNLKSKREELLKRIAVIDEKAMQRQKLQGYLAKVAQRISEIQSKNFAGINVADVEDIISNLTAEINQIEKTLEKQRATINMLTGQNGSLQAILKKLNTTRCPLSDRLVCNTDKSSLTAELQNQIIANDQVIQEATATIKNLENKLQVLKTKKEQIEYQVKLTTDLNELLEQEETLKKDLAAIEVEDKTSLVAELNGCDKLYELLTQQQSMHHEWEQKKAEVDKLAKQLAQAEEQVQLYEYLVKEFSPKGVKTRILQKIIEPIETYCNEKLAVLTNNNYKIKFGLDDGFEILVENQSGVVNLNSLSNSEKMRLGIIFQDAINSLTGVRILFIDNAEILDNENTILLLELLKIIKDNYDSIFVIMTSENKNLLSQLANLPDSKAFFVSEGNVEEV